MNTSSSEGELYNPKHVLAAFLGQRYMKILLEQGWIGFAIHLLLYFVILRRGINCFIAAKNPDIKTIYLHNRVPFAVIVGIFSDCHFTIPLILFYYSSLAVFIN
jgi:hypothetical protein